MIELPLEITEEDSMETISDKLGFNKATKTAFVDSTHGNHSAVILTPESFINIITCLAIFGITSHIFLILL